MTAAGLDRVIAARWMSAAPHSTPFHPMRRGWIGDVMSDTRMPKRAYRVRLRLKPAQERSLSRLLGAKRLVRNWALRRKAKVWHGHGTKPNDVALLYELTVLLRQSETVWLATLPREPFNQVLRDFDRAGANFFADRAKRPYRKKRASVDAVRFTLDQRRQQVNRTTGIVQFDGIGKVRFRVAEALVGRLRSVTVCRDNAGRWFATFPADGFPSLERMVTPRAAVDIDLGLKDTTALSTSKVIAAPKHLAAKLAKSRRYQRSSSRQADVAVRRHGLAPVRLLPKGTRLQLSSRMKRRRRHIGQLHARLADARRNHQHQLTAKVVARAQVITIEDLADKAMARGGRTAFRRSVADTGIGEIRRQLTYRPTGTAGSWSSSIASTRVRPVRRVERSTPRSGWTIASERVVSKITAIATLPSTSPAKACACLRMNTPVRRGAAKLTRGERARAQSAVYRRLNSRPRRTASSSIARPSHAPPPQLGRNKSGRGDETPKIA